MKKINRGAKQLIGAGLLLGVGGAVLGQMGQGSNQVTTPITNMAGPLLTAGIGLYALDMVSEGTKSLQRKKSSKYNL